MLGRRRAIKVIVDCFSGAAGAVLHADLGGQFPVGAGQPGLFEDAFQHQGLARQRQDLVGVLLFLSSSASDFCTGQTMFVDGGYTAG